MRAIPSHSHSNNSYEIHYVPYGKGHVKIDGTSYEIVPNTLYITGPNIEHEQIPNKEDPMIEYRVYINIEKQKPVNKQKRNSIYQSPVSEKHSNNDYIEVFENTKFWFGQDTRNIHQIMQQLFNELENRNTGYITQAETLLQQLIVQIVRNYESKTSIIQPSVQSNLFDSKYLIIEEYFLYEYRELNLSILAKRLGLSPRQTERLLKEHYNKTFLQKKSEAKMSAAAIMLMNKDKRITDIAMDLGYSSVEHFSNAFRKYYKEPARNFRKRINER